MNLNQLFFDFCRELGVRKHLLTEDNIRYYWFAQMLKQDQVLDHYCLEAPYSTWIPQNQAMQRKQLDLYYNDGNKDVHFVEMKFYRKVKGSSLTMTEDAGKLINDMYRLNTIPSSLGRRLFLFVTDDCMENYLCLNTRTSNFGNLPFRLHLKEILTLQQDQTIDVSFENKPDTPATFVKRAKLEVNLSTKLKVKMLEHKDNLKTASVLNLHIRLYEIMK